MDENIIIIPTKGKPVKIVIEGLHIDEDEAVLKLLEIFARRIKNEN